MLLHEDLAETLLQQCQHPDPLYLLWGKSINAEKRSYWDSVPGDFELCPVYCEANTEPKLRSLVEVCILC